MMFARRQLLLMAVLVAAGCNGSAASELDTRAHAGARIVALNGAGASFPYPLYSKWVAEYNRLNGNIRINYQSIGSGGGIRQIVARTVDFGASDAPMRDEEVAHAPGKLLHVPTTLGSVVIGYRIPGLDQPLRLSGASLARIFLGQIKTWNHPALVADNPGVALPPDEIAVIFRADGSGTTAVFTEFLASVSPEFKDQVGTGKSVKWPVGIGAKGNEGVTGLLKSTPAAIGYVELAYAVQNKLNAAAIENKSGKFVRPSAAAATAAAESVEMPESLHVSLAGASAEGAYPLASYTYLLVYEDAEDPLKGESLARFLWWAIHEGQRFAPELDYAPLPARVVSRIEERLRQLRSGDKKLLEGV